MSRHLNLLPLSLLLLLLLPLLVSAQPPRSRCPSQCFLRRALAIEACRSGAALRLGNCRVRACERSDGSAGFRCVQIRPAASPLAARSQCPNTCALSFSEATLQCTQPALFALACNVRACTEPNGGGFGCVGCPNVCAFGDAIDDVAAACARRRNMIAGCELRDCTVDGQEGRACVLPPL